MRTVLQAKFYAVLAILVEQRDHPGYADTILHSIVDSELRKLAAETDMAAARAITDGLRAI